MTAPRDEQQSLSEALNWLIELREAQDGDPRYRHWQAWLAVSGQNRQAWQRVETLGQRLSGSQGRLLLHALRSTPVQASRRAFVGKLCLLLGGAGTLAYSGQRLVWPELSAGYHTGTGELRNLALDNHLQLTLNTATALDVQHEGQSTLIGLLKGEIMVDSRQVVSASTQVQLAQARIRAGQARFSVRALEGEPQRVCVYQGQLNLNLGAQEHQLVAGQQLLFSPNDVRREALPLASDAWTRGLLITDGMPLAVFTRELDRYRSGRLHCDPQVAALRVSGAFDLKHPEQVLATLGQVLPVKVQYRTRYWATVVAAV
jgi:transmembrane sensor